MSYQKGFTLLELMIVLMIFSILAAMAIASYEQFIVRNAQSEAQAQMGQLEMQLERWRASALSYKGFVPAKVDSTGATSFAYDDAGNTTIYVPVGSNNTNYRYKIELFDGSTCSQNATTCASLNPPNNTAATTVEVGVGRSWTMKATPRPDTAAARKGMMYVQRSTGFRCAKRFASTASGNLSEQSESCTGAGLEAW